MYDIKFIRQFPQKFDQAMIIRGVDIKAEAILAIDALVRNYKNELQISQARRNNLAKEIAECKVAKQTVAEELYREAELIKKDIPILTQKLQEKEKELNDILVILPNAPQDDVPFGTSESDNLLIKSWGEPRFFDFQPLQHFELGEKLQEMDFAAAAAMSGSRFVVLYGMIARLERALSNLMLDIHTKEFGYLEVSPPLLVHNETMFGVGQLPKFAEDTFIVDGNYRLIPTAEVPLTYLAANKIIAEENLPFRYTAYTPCFRSEAGSAGRDTRGMIRMHQFNKVELVSITTPEQSEAEHLHMLTAAETVLQRLELPYRVMLLCSQDMGFCSSKTYDIEVWLPGQNQYREISSCSNCMSFQATRMKAYYRDSIAQENKHIHTLNGSGLAVGRTLVAILENYQQADGSVVIPDALRGYM